MATSFSGTVKANLSLNLIDNDTSLASAPQDPLSKAITKSLTDGAGALQAEDLFHRRATLAAAASTGFDFSGTALQNVFGTDIAWARLKGLLIDSRTASSDSSLRITGNLWDVVSGVASSRTIVKPGGFCLIVAPDAAGYAITNSTADTITIAHHGDGSLDADYDFIAWGANS